LKTLNIALEKGKQKSESQALRRTRRFGEKKLHKKKKKTQKTGNVVSAGQLGTVRQEERAEFFLSSKKGQN